MGSEVVQYLDPCPSGQECQGHTVWQAMCCHGALTYGFLLEHSVEVDALAWQV